MSPRIVRLVVIVLLLVAAYARFWDITHFPPGLFPDQAANGEDALTILQGDLRPFYERNNGREGLFFYLQAAAIAMFGVGVWPMFATSAAVGLLTAWCAYRAARRLFGLPAALLTLAFLATNPWHVTLSRTGFRAILVPLFIALSCWAAAEVAQSRTLSRRVGWALLLGISYGLGWYSYIAYRVTLPVVIILGMLLFFGECVRRPRWIAMRRVGGASLIAVVAALCVLTPLALYFLDHPGTFLSRAGQVSVFNPDLNDGHVAQTVVDVLRKSVLGFFIEGDRNPRHNVPGAPFLSPVAALFFLVGFCVVVVRSGKYFHQLFRGLPSVKDLPFLLVLLLLLFSLAPAVATAEGIPHGLRSVGELPVVIWVAGIGGAAIWGRMRRFPSVGAQQLGLASLGALVAFTMMTDLVLYFGVARSHPETWRAYRADLTTVSSYLTGRSATGRSPAYLVLDRFSEQTVHFLTTPSGYPYRLVVPEESSAITLESGDVIVFTQSTLPDAEHYKTLHPEVTELLAEKNPFGETAMVVLERSSGQ